MLKAIEGVFQDGKVEFLEPVAELDGTRVVVTFLPDISRGAAPASLGSSPYDKEHAAALRAKLSTFIEDWDRPEMDIYNDM